MFVNKKRPVSHICGIMEMIIFYTNLIFGPKKVFVLLLSVCLFFIVCSSRQHFEEVSSC